jgi:hypothetical protein
VRRQMRERGYEGYVAKDEASRALRPGTSAEVSEWDNRLRSSGDGDRHSSTGSVSGRHAPVGSSVEGRMFVRRQ